jgi:hypothetical protein
MDKVKEIFEKHSKFNLMDLQQFREAILQFMDEGSRGYLSPEIYKQYLEGIDYNGKDDKEI